MLEVCSSFSLRGVSNKYSGGPVASRIKCKFFVNSSLISSACLSYLVTKCTSMFHSFVVFAYTVPSAWKSWNLSQPPTFRLETSSSSSRLYEGVTVWMSSFSNLPGIPDDSAWNFHWTLYMEPAACLEVYLFDFIY